MNYGAIVTPEQAKEKHGDTRPLNLLYKLAYSKGICECGQPIWKAGGHGMCFECDTGSSDASSFIELKPK